VGADASQSASIAREMIEEATNNFGAAGRSLVAAAWILAIAPFAVFFFSLSIEIANRWFWDVLPILLWAFPLAVLACAVALTRRETTIWKKILGWMAFGMSLVLSWELLHDFHGI
jgi:hypothetical protein